jgi:fructose-1,6-bisphosphatase II
MAQATPDRNLSLDLVRVTEAAALAAGRHMGLGKDADSERAAAEAMLVMLQSVEMSGTIVIGQRVESAPDMLCRGTDVGSGSPPDLDVAVDPVEGVELLSLGRANALSVIAASGRGSLFDPGPIAYMRKIAVGRSAAGAIDITKPVEDNLRAIARANRKDLDDLTIVVLDRPRHAGLIDDIRATGARIRLITHGDVAGAIMPAFEDTGIDALLGTGGAPEGVIAAAALKCLGGAIHARLEPRNDTERKAALDAGYDLDKVLHTDELVAGDDVFFAATGITTGEVLRGVQYHGEGAMTYSVTMRSRSGTVRMVESHHRWDKLMRISRVAYDTR